MNLKTLLPFYMIIFVCPIKIDTVCYVFPTLQEGN